MNDVIKDRNIQSTIITLWVRIHTGGGGGGAESRREEMLVKSI
jgi:hypothetical protein